MHLAILMTNTDESPFSQTRPRDGEKFTTLIQEFRPDWKCDVFSVKDGVFPTDINAFDGIMITGSPASVHDDADWIAELYDTIRKAEAAQTPMFGACFGHQAIAMALGGKVGKNPEGWVHGHVTAESVRARPYQSQTPDQIGLYASHIEQVTQMPVGAEVVAKGPGCNVGGFAIGSHVFTTQYHPEMSHEFISDLVEETADYVGPEVTQQARESLKNRADRAAMGNLIVEFFEWAKAQSA